MLGLSEYECVVTADAVATKAIEFTRERFGKQVLVAAVGAPMQQQSLALAELHAQHVLLRVDDEPVDSYTSLEQLSRRILQSEKGVRLRLRDPRRRALEIRMLKDDPVALAHMQPLVSRIDLEQRLTQAQEHIWAHRLDDALSVLATLPPGADPRVQLLRLDVQFTRVLISNDALHIKQALRTAERAVKALRAFLDLPSLAPATRLSVQLALAEAQLQLSVLQVLKDKKLQALVTLRAAATAFGELQRQLEPASTGPVAVQRMPPVLRTRLVARMRFGLGVLQLLPSIASSWFAIDWLRSVVQMDINVREGLSHLLACATVENERSAWAALALFHCATALRLVKADGPTGADDFERLTRQITTELRPAFLLRYPRAVLLLWSASFVGVQVISPKAVAADDYLDQALQLVDDNDRAHLVVFDAARRRFCQHAFDQARSLLTRITSSATAPHKLRGMSSLFLAATLLLRKHQRETNGDDHVVRMLLRTALQCLQLVEDTDAEAATLVPRIQAYLDGSDWHLRLLPSELLYVHCLSDVGVHQQSAQVLHHRHLNYLHDLGAPDDTVASPTSQSQARLSSQRTSLEVTTWMVLSAIVTMQLDATDERVAPARQSLMSLASNHRHLALPPQSFLVPVACFHVGRFDLQQVSMGSVVQTTALVRQAWQHNPKYEYQQQYQGKLQALEALLRRKELQQVDANVGS